jgi:hypothetical protein
MGYDTALGGQSPYFSDLRCNDNDELVAKRSLRWAPRTASTIMELTRHRRSPALAPRSLQGRWHSLGHAAFPICNAEDSKMKTAVIAAICAAAAVAMPAIAQFPETGGVSSQTGPTAKGSAAGTVRPATDSNSPAQSGTSAHDNSRGNNSTSPSDGPAGTPVPNGEKTVAGTATTNSDTAASSPSR